MVDRLSVIVHVDTDGEIHLKTHSSVSACVEELRSLVGSKLNDEFFDRYGVDVDGDWSSKASSQ